MSGYNISLTEEDKVGFFSVKWSPFILLDKRKIRTMIPAEAGIFQIFFNKNNSLIPVSCHQAYYGGLRGIFLEILDEDCQVSFPGKEKIRKEETYIRYSLSTSKNDLRDVLHYYTGSENSGRFVEIMIEETECMKVAR